MMSDLSYLQVLSLLVNSLFSALALWGLCCFWPKRSLRKELGPTYMLMIAIWLGFLGVGLNVFYWRVFGDIAVQYGLIGLPTLRQYGAYGDLIWKTLGLVSIYLHFYARWMSLPEDRAGWPILLVAFYPDKGHWVVRFSEVFRAKRNTSGE